MKAPDLKVTFGSFQPKPSGEGWATLYDRTGNENRYVTPKPTDV